MLSSNQPTLVPLAFAASGAKNVIPEGSQIGITPGAASLTDGFPPLTRTPIASGGIPPAGQDMNGILNLITQLSRWQSAGAGITYNSAFATDTNVNGYPNGALLLRADGTGFWQSTADNNTNNPDTGGANWVPVLNTGVTAVTMTNANVTLSNLQAAKNVITISGTLTANLNLIFPTTNKRWLVINNATGAYTITCKTASGTGAIAIQGRPMEFYGDGTNLQSLTPVPATNAQVTAGTDPNAYLTPSNLTTILAAVYPVGSLYSSTTSTNPATLFGFGTWAAYAAGRVMVGVGTSDQAFALGATGGESNHTLSVAEIPAHHHLESNPQIKAGGLSWNASGGSVDVDSSAVNTGDTGGGGAHNNLQPYIVVSIWQRTA